MSAAKESAKEEPKTSYRITGGGWANAWKIALVVGVIGLGASFAGASTDVHRFAYSYLFAYLCFFTVGTGAIFFVLIQRLTSANWSVTVRRIAEFFMAGLPVLLLLFIPVLGTMGHVFPWMHPAEATHETAAVVAGHEGGPGQNATSSEAAMNEEHAGADARGGTLAEAEQVEHEDDARLLQEKKSYLNVTFFGIRLAIYFAIFLLSALSQYRWSTRQDDTKDPKFTVLAQKWAPLSTIGCGLSLTFAGFDWVMSLYPYWYSTIFGVWFFATTIVVIHALLALVSMSLGNAGLLGDAVNTEHYHDLGKLTFGFIVFWAYISFAQFFLTWYAGIPEETTFYHFRWGLGPWRWVSLGLILGKFAVPFLVLLSRNVKRRLSGLAIGCAIVIVLHVIEMYWAVLANYVPQAGMEPGDVLQLHWLDATCFVGVGGVYLAWVFREMTRHPLIPVGDPRLPRSLAFENA